MSLAMVCLKFLVGFPPTSAGVLKLVRLYAQSHQFESDVIQRAPLVDKHLNLADYDGYTHTANAPLERRRDEGKDTAND